MTEKKKILGPIEWIALLCGIALIAYLTLRQAGYKMIERSVETEFIDPATSNQLKPPAKKNSSSETQVNKMLSEMAATFQENQDSKSQSVSQNTIQEKWNLSESEALFYDKIQETNPLGDKIKSANDWFKFLNTSRKTYFQVKNLFAELSPNQSQATNASEILENEAAASDFYQKMEDWYDLSAEDVQSFASKGKNSLEDWAAFLAQQAYDSK